MNKYVCPDCGGKLAIWREKLTDVYIPINVKTGKPLKKKPTHGAIDYTDCCGLYCLSCGNRTYNMKGQDTFTNDIKDLEDEIFDKFESRYLR